MSTLDVACARCDKRFRVRAEFAGKATRCPACSAPITIGAAQAPPRRPEPTERPRSRPKPRDDEDDGPRPPAGDWKPVDTALGREQVAVVCGLITLLCGFLAFCLLRAAEGTGAANEAVLVLALLLLVGPALVSATFGLTARVAALRSPASVAARGTAVSSLLCAIAGVASLVVLGGAVLMSIERHGPEPVAMIVGWVGVVVSSLAAVGTFAGFVAQVGIARRSAGVSRAIGGAAVAVSACLLGVLGIALLIALAIEMTAPTPGYGGYQSHHEGEAAMGIIVGVLTPVALIVVLILYHRLLGSARRAVRGETGERDEG
jgi:uncharacterized membrane protein